MTKELPPAYDPKKVEDKIYKMWEESGYFQPENLPAAQINAEDDAERRRKKSPRSQPKSAKSAYTIVVPPPNVTGSLHMGHALNATIQDILIRKKRMEGYKTLWLPGTDHAGIATQNVVEKELKKQGLSRHDLGREKFLEKIWEWKEKYGNIILNQFKKLGSSMDWSRARFTMDEDYQKAVTAAFNHYHKKGWLYKAERVINWCIKDQTSLSDLELEYKEEKGKLWYIRYPLISKAQSAKRKAPNNSRLALSDSQYVVVATTRPETMLGDSAVAVHPKDKRYKNLVGKKLLLPIQNRKIPIIADEEIDMEFGTGAVKVTPAHDLLDARIGEKHKLPIYKVIGPLGKMIPMSPLATGTPAARGGLGAEEGVLKEYAGLKIKDCREKIVEELKKQNLIEKEEDYTHNVALCYRCGTVIEPLPSLQWFLKMEELAKVAVEAVKNGEVAFHPKHWEKVYLDWLENIRDWNISRQIWWGHQMPAWNHEPKCVPKTGHEGDVVKCEEIIISATEPKCEFCDAKFIQETDVLDTWFSSALWPFATLGWPDKNAKDFKDFYPTQVLSTARDIINLWVSRMVFSGLELTGEKPFTDVIIHGTILTKEGKRMSKSLGTGIDPMLLIEKYGADATRFGLIWQAMGGQDIHWDENAVMAGKKFANKVWNATRFVLMATDKFTTTYNHPPKKITEADTVVLDYLESVKKGVSNNIDRYSFGVALHDLYDFFWHEFCDIYLEEAKKQLQNEELKENTKEILSYTLYASLKLLHPFMPHLTEEIYQNLPVKNEKMIMIEKW